MANCENLLISLREQLTCSLCFETFKNPKTVPCLHSFCCECLNKLANKRFCSQPLRCPQCLEVIDLPQGKDTFEGFPSSFYLKRLLNVTGIQFDSNKNLQQACGSCEIKGTVEAFCLECECFVCKHCFELHSKIKSMKSHRISDKNHLKENDVREVIQQMSMFCKKRFHENEPLKYYCRDCKRSICDKCAILGHKKHNLELIQEIMKEYKHQIKNSKEKLCKKISSFEDQIKAMEREYCSLQDRLSSARFDLKSHTESLIRKIRQHEKNMEKEIDCIQRDQHKLYMSNKKSLEIRVVQMKSAEDFASQLLQRNIYSEILQTEDLVTQRLNDLLEDEEKLQTIRRTNIDYVPDGEFLHVLELTELGKLIKSYTDPLCCNVDWQEDQSPCALERNHFTVTTRDSDGNLTSCETGKCFLTKLVN